MNRFSKYVAAAALMVVPSMLSAQASAVGFGISGGLSVPTGDFGDAVDAGYSIAGHVFLKPASMKSLRFRGDVSFDSYAYKGNIDGDARVLGFIGNALLDLSTNGGVKPYVLGGLGAFNTKASTKVGSVNVSSSDTNVGIQIGGGLNFQLSGFSTFLEAKYVNVFTENNSTGYIPITFGIRF
ncbi:outer membrane beta-barrel protein [Gemmatimonas sp.]|uniref:outer membrane beta-barrel protein n=1 Tax=Gemmatimonas sp. TaxID=1962908 RepID=UPI003982DC5B